MSSSPSRSLAVSADEVPADAIPAHGVGPSAGPVPEMQPFPYDAVPPGTPSDAAASSADGDETAAGENLARAQGRQEGQAEARKVFAEQLARERAGLAAALEQFTRDRARYFETVEGEVVQLALAIARKILHREAQLDPLLLAGIVRVALEKLDGATRVVLRLHPQNAADWRRYLATHLGLSDMPEIVEDPALEIDRCTLETSMGSAIVGLEVQLKEIEQGLMDLLAARPEVVRTEIARTGAAS
jgi:flagellar biosynthesis/type III secretory pathway protein FliH